MADNTADFVTILSSELIAEIVEGYFNSEMYKVAVKVVDLKPTADGYAFSLAFLNQKEKNTVATFISDDFYENGTAIVDKRDGKGRFVKLNSGLNNNLSEGIK